jgi:3-oxoacyl-[acyl-carrier-protein] synthase-3
MAAVTTTGTRIAGICSAVPETSFGMDQMQKAFGDTEAARVAKSTGVYARRKGSAGVCASDLCCAAAIRLLRGLNWDPATVQALVFISQTPDFRLPATACLLQHRLGLSKKCIAFDVNLGCSGYIYGIWMASQFMKASGLTRILLLVGDTITRYVDQNDRSTAPIFGDAGTATALESDIESKMSFVLGTDGSGGQNLIIPAGASRTALATGASSQPEAPHIDPISSNHLQMNGTEVFSFTIREVPPMLEDILKEAGWSWENVDHFIFHQANRFILDYLAKKSGIPTAKIPLSLADFGNTSSASIPLTISACLRDRLGSTEPRKLILAGFGVGWSWGACAMETRGVILPPIIEIPDP